MSLLMGMDKNGLKRLHGVMKQSMRMNYYPPCSRPDLVHGVSPHSDGGSLSVLLQDDDITGLQIKYKGRWIPVKPIPNALVINIADITEVLNSLFLIHCLKLQIILSKEFNSRTIWNVLHLTAL